MLPSLNWRTTNPKIAAGSVLWCLFILPSSFVYPAQLIVHGAHLARISIRYPGHRQATQSTQSSLMCLISSFSACVFRVVGDVGFILDVAEMSRPRAADVTYVEVPNPEVPFFPPAM
ncbi:hypothetical protein B0H13DRAFT_2349931 [Mycena leptocephala]|nr:hypothetical protein B0H13DRAFT_2349931 [Mycena leptocephala]